MSILVDRGVSSRGGGRMMNLTEWQNRLGLQDWTIKLYEDCSPNDMTLMGCAGEVEYSEPNKSATIRIIGDKDYGDRIIPFNPEKTLVHELLHLKFCLLDETENSLQNRLVHQLIDDLARAFVDAKRSIEPFANDTNVGYKGVEE